jgi:teichuronic acid biosynthesis glycosyltransferase TuaC
VRLLRRDGFEFDVIDAHYLYPDGVAASVLSRWIGKPFVLTARGSDLNVLVERPYIRRRIVTSAHRAARVLCVSSALRDRARDIGIRGECLEVSRNGVDTTLFDIRDRDRSRRLLALPDTRHPLMLCVGNLVVEKGHELAVRALSQLPTTSLLIVGNGPLRPALQALGERLGVQERLMFRDAMPQRDLVNVYNAADILLHPSLREGWPNVLLESMACGTGVVATDVGAASEIISDPVAGTLVPDRSPGSVASAVAARLRQPPRRSAVRAHAACFGWATVAQRCRDVLSQAIAGSESGRTGRTECAT